MSLKTDKVQLEILLKGDKARAELTELEITSRKLKNELKKLPEGTEEFVRKSAELKKVQTRMDELRNKIGLTGMTMRELRQRSKELMFALNNINPNTPQYKELRGELDKVNNRMRELKGGAQQTGFSFGKMADGFNKYMGVFAAISASIIGVVFSMRKMVDAFDEYESKVASLSALTGLTGNDLDWISNKAKELSTSVTEDGIRITKSADDIVDAFTKMASARPELLNNKEALAEVTEQAIILSEAAGMDLDTAISSLANTMNQFDIASENAGKTINVLAAGSKYGAAQVDYVTEAIVKMGPAAKSANVPLEDSVALIETLAEGGLQAEIAGTGLRNFMLKTQTGSKEFNPAIVGMKQALDNLAAANLSTADLVKMFGLENVTTAQMLINSRDRYAELTKQVTGTNVAMEQATITTSTHKAELEQAKNRAHNMAIELGERLAPIMTFSTNTATMFLKALMRLPEILRENKYLFMALGVALLAYNAHKIKGIALKIRDFALMKTGITLRAKEYAQYQLLIYQEKLAAAQKMNLAKSAGFLQGTIQKLWAVMKMNPLGAIIIAAGAVLTIFTALRNTFSSVTASQKLFNEANKKAAEYAAQERSELGLLIVELKNSKAGTDERKTAIEKLNSTYGKYLPNLLKENASYQDIVKALIAINAQIELKAKLQAYDEMLTEAYKEQAKIQMELANATGMYKKTLEGAYDNSITVIHDITTEIVRLRNEQAAANVQTENSTDVMSDYSVAVDDAATSSENLSEKTKEIKTAYELLNEEISKYEKLLQDQVVSHDANASVTASKLADLKQEKELYDELIKNLQDAAYIQQELDKMGDPTIMRSITLKNNQRSNKQVDLGEKIYTPEKATYWEDAYSESQKLFADYEQAKFDFYQNLQSQMIDIAKGTADTIFAYQSKKSNQQYNEDKAALEARYANGLLQETEYNAALKALDEKKAAEDAKIKKRAGIFEKAMTAGQIGITAIKDTAAIKMQAAVLAANPLTLGYVPAALAQIPIVIGTAALQTGLALAKPIAEYSKGLYSVTGTSGRKYNASWSGNPRTGIYSSPTFGFINGAPGIWGEAGRELVVDYPTLRNLEMRSPEVIDYIYKTAGRTREYAEGNYPDSSTATKSDKFSPGVSSAAFNMLVEQNKQMINLLAGINSQLANSYTFKDLSDRIDEETSRKDFISNKMSG
ncbi:MAG: phage tail tape measure protein [Bacteroidetes bacterium HGW-Bacteroidetes-6]|jgi:TP901 family phage tail tape measure protein|nr:MAG: phage tail tape measure protein [Bacteroidetes bacterium HGW-Bacteroidetes-6]